LEWREKIGTFKGSGINQKEFQEKGDVKIYDI
jgi:hypothetical protein